MVYHWLLYMTGVVYRNHIYQHLCISIVSENCFFLYEPVNTKMVGRNHSWKFSFCKPFVNMRKWLAETTLLICLSTPFLNGKGWYTETIVWNLVSANHFPSSIGLSQIVSRPNFWKDSEFEEGNKKFSMCVLVWPPENLRKVYIISCVGVVLCNPFLGLNSKISCSMSMIWEFHIHIQNPLPKWV